MSIDWGKIRTEYETTDIQLKELADKYNISPGTVRSRKNREKWQRNATENDATQVQNVAIHKGKKKERHEKDTVKQALTVVGEDLTDKQKLFCLYYIKYFNATKAYLKAYECSYRVAHASGSRLLAKAKVKEEIQKLKATKFKGAMLEPGDLLQKYIDIAFADISDFLEFGQHEIPMINQINGQPLLDNEGKQIIEVHNYVNFKDSNNMDTTILSEVKQGKEGISIKLQDKMKALDFLAKHIGLLDIETRERLKIAQQKVDIERERLEHTKEMDRLKVF